MEHAKATIMGAVLKDYRTNVLGLTCDQFALRIGLTGSLVSAMENGKTISNNTLRLLKEHFPELHAKLAAIRVTELYEEIGYTPLPKERNRGATDAHEIQKAIERLLLLSKTKEEAIRDLEQETRDTLGALLKQVIPEQLKPKKKGGRRR